MQPNDRATRILEDIQDAASFILDVTKHKMPDDYPKDRLLKQAVERNFETPGEAMGRLARVDSGISSRINEHARMIAFRNVLIHGYDRVDDALVWDTIRTKLPILL